MTKSDLAVNYRKIRSETERICSLLQPDDYQVQSIIETSPPKWHLAHVSWFFESFVLSVFTQAYHPFHPKFSYLFNSYYETVGKMQPRPQRGMLSRPTVEEIYYYRAYVDEHMLNLIDEIEVEKWQAFAFSVVLGLNHEQQHQELLFMDIKHNLSVNPLKPAYSDKLTAAVVEAKEMGWIEQTGGLADIGHSGVGFAYDNETPRHQVLVQDHKLATRPVNNEEYLAFIEDDGYLRADLWLSDGWAAVKQGGWQHPLYWQKIDNNWYQYTLGGMRKLNFSEPVCHVSFYEANAYASWSGKRLPIEAELELMLASQPLEGNFTDHNMLHPRAGHGQWYGDVWEWCATPYGPYPGFKPLEGSVGEYNGKFMCNQMVLRGGCCVTPESHIRASYRNFFYPHDRWAFTGIRLAENL